MGIVPSPLPVIHVSDLLVRAASFEQLIQRGSISLGHGIQKRSGGELATKNEPLQEE